MRHEFSWGRFNTQLITGALFHFIIIRVIGFFGYTFHFCVLFYTQFQCGGCRVQFILNIVWHSFYFICCFFVGTMWDVTNVTLKAEDITLFSMLKHLFKFRCFLLWTGAEFVKITNRKRIFIVWTIFLYERIDSIYRYTKKSCSIFVGMKHLKS